MIGRNRPKTTAAEASGPLPHPGQAIWIENTRVGPLQSRALDVRDGRVCIDPPRSGGELIALPREARLSYQVSQVPCEARASHADPPAGSEPGLWYEVETVTRMQRRRAVRVPVMLMARVLDDEGEEVIESGVTEDLSANGVLLRMTDPMEVNQVVRVVLHLGGSAGDLDTRARVVRADHEPDAARPWRVAMTFPDLARAAEDRVVRFLFERQRELRRRDGGE